MDRNKVKNARRTRRKLHIRRKLQGTSERPRVTVTRSLRHIYCQVIDDTQGRTLVSASTLSPELRAELGTASGSKAGASKVGELLAKKAQGLGITAVAFDRNGYAYHGRVAAVAEALRKAGIQV
ncbi:MAG: 50S ribosomal protein L18 [Planctomycetota bacterium]